MPRRLSIPRLSITKKDSIDQVYLDLLDVKSRAQFLVATDLFEGSSMSTALEVAEHFEPRLMHQNESIIEQGEIGKYFFLIVIGWVQIFIKNAELNNIREVAKWGPGSCFGEGSLLSGHSTSATVVALGKGVILALSKDKFKEFITKNQIEKLKHKWKIRQFQGQPNILNVLIEEELGETSLKSFMKKVYCEEIFKFYTAVMQYRELSPEQRRGKAKQIWDLHLGRGSLYEINTSTDNRAAVEVSLNSSDTIPSNLFDTILVGIVKDIYQDILPRYFASSEYRDFVQKKFPKSWIKESSARKVKAVPSCNTPSHFILRRSMSRTPKVAASSKTCIIL